MKKKKKKKLTLLDVTTVSFVIESVVKKYEDVTASCPVTGNCTDFCG